MTNGPIHVYELKIKPKSKSFTPHACTCKNVKTFFLKITEDENLQFTILTGCDNGDSVSLYYLDIKHNYDERHRYLRS